MGPHSLHPLRARDWLPHQVIKTDVVLAQRRIRVLHVLHVPSDRVEALTEPRLELADRRLLCAWDSGQLHGLHDTVTDAQERGFTDSRLHVCPVEAPRCKDVVIPFVYRIEVTHNMGEMKQLTDLEHSAAPYL